MCDRFCQEPTVWSFFSKYNRDMGVATGITSMKTEFMTIIGLEVTRTTSDRTVADSEPLSLMQLVIRPIRDW